MAHKMNFYIAHDIKEVTTRLNYLKAIFKDQELITHTPKYYIDLLDQCTNVIEKPRTMESFMLFQLLTTFKKKSQEKSIKNKTDNLIQKLIAKHPIKIAIVDNNELTLQLYKDCMTDPQISIETFQIPDNFLIKLKQGDKFDCIICDKNFGLYSIVSTRLFGHLKKMANVLKLLVTHEELDADEKDAYKTTFDYVLEKDICSFADMIKLLKH
ncbi:MAG: response regulator [Oligoflexia bacterium]|nr:response regulator [Oligoflexia bacterium]